jgi:hypothetical protein
MERGYQPIIGLREIRILFLHPGASSDRLIGRLEHAELDAKPTYEALSYEWGSPEKEHKILLESGGQQFIVTITRSLHNALFDLRYEDISRGSRAIWADGICIDQENLKEREQQVSIMGPVYQSATRVVTYIGPEENDSELAIDFAYSLWKSYMPEEYQSSISSTLLSSAQNSGTLTNISTVPSTKSTPSLALSIRPATFAMTIVTTALSAETSYYENLPNPDHEFTLSLNDIHHNFPQLIRIHHEALKKLILRGWPSRCWCAEEFLLNSVLTLMCGRREIDAFLIPDVVQLVFNRVLPPWLLPTSLEDPKSLRECLATLIHVRDSLVLDGKRLTMLDLLISLHALQASDPRDKIYALLALASDRDSLRIEIDYSCTMESLYTQVATRIINAYQPITLLYSNLGIKSFEFPSWVPDWSSWRFGTGGMLVESVSFASGSTKASMRVVGNGILEVTGSLFDQIVHLSEPLGPRFSIPFASTKHRNEDKRDKLEEDPDPSIHGQDGEAMLSTHDWMAMQADIVTHLHPYPDGSSPSEVFWRTLICNMTLYEAPAGANHGLYFEAYQRVCSGEAFRDSSAQDSSMLTVTYDMAKEFHDTIRRRMRYRRLCVTAKKYFGAVPEESQVGDWVCVIDGARAPFVLRDMRTEKGGFKLIGPSYVQGLMKGECLKMEDYKKEKIQLI